MHIITPTEYYLNLQTDTSKEVYEYTCLLMQMDKGIPKPLGSGVFVEVNDSFFLFTAAHVIESTKTEIVVGLSEYLPLGGELTINQLRPTQSREKDKNDIAILKLDLKIVHQLKSTYKFMPKSELGINHKDEFRKRYIAVGFPEKKQKFNSYKREFSSTPFVYSTGSADQSAYETLGLLQYINHIVNFKRKKIQNHRTKKIITSPDLHGMSGCGLWHIPLQLVNPSQYIQKYLVTILTEWPVQHKEFLIGTRIDLFTEIIRKKYSLDLPISEIVTADA